MGQGIIVRDGYYGIDPDECTATKEQVLSGYKAGVKNEDEPVAGTLPNCSGIKANATFWYRGYLIFQGPHGYYQSSNSDGDYDIYIDPNVAASGIGITADKIIKSKSIGPVNGTATSDATATAPDVLSNKTVYVDGVKVTGTMPNRGIGQHGPGSGLNSSGLYYYIPSGYYPMEGSYNPWVYRSRAEVASTIGLTAAKLMKGQSCLDISGTATGDANAISSHILAGDIVYVNGSKVTGTMRSMAGQTITPKASQQTISCSGKYMTGNITVAGDSDLNGSNIRSGKNIFGVVGTMPDYSYLAQGQTAF